MPKYPFPKGKIQKLADLYEEVVEKDPTVNLEAALLAIVKKEIRDPLEWHKWEKAIDDEVMRRLVGRFEARKKDPYDLLGYMMRRKRTDNREPSSIFRPGRVVLFPIKGASR